MENYLGITGAWLGPEPQEGLLELPNPIGQGERAAGGILISALAMPPALALPHSHSDILQDSTGQAPCASLAAVSMPPSVWLSHNVPDLQRPTTCCHSPESYLKKIAYSHGFFRENNKANEIRPNLSSPAWIYPILPSHRDPHQRLHSTLHNTAQKCLFSNPAFPLHTEAGLLLLVSPVPPLLSAFHSDAVPPLPPPQSFSVHPGFWKGG